MTPPAAEDRCRMCDKGNSHLARKCAWCGEWLVDARISPRAAALRVVGWVWLNVSVASAMVVAVLSYRIRNIESDLVAGGLLASWGYGLAVGAVLEGLLLGLGAVVIAENSARRPDWY
jgi:hypothetical protein